MASVSICIDVSDLPLATRFYCEALGCLIVKTRTSHTTLSAEGVTVQLLLKEAGTEAHTTPGCIRTYERHWTPVHLDFEVSNIDETMSSVERLGGKVEEVKRSDWGAAAFCADPFGNGLCLVTTRTPPLGEVEEARS